MNGKGDTPRPVNINVYRANYDAINWHREPSTNEQQSTQQQRSLALSRQITDDQAFS